MTLNIRKCHRLAFLGVLSILFNISITTNGATQGPLDPRRGPLGCVPVAERQMERGCYIILSHNLGLLPATTLFWHIDSFPTRATAEAAKMARSSVMEALGKIWLLTIAEAGWRPTGGERAAELGPLQTTAGTAYTAAYMEAIMLPGAETAVHRHAGPETLYTLAGEECMETPAGKFISRPGSAPIIVPANVPHKLTITGTGERRSLALILHDSSQPVVNRAHDHGWTAKELCRN